MQWDNKHKSTPETQVLVLEYAKSFWKSICRKGKSKKFTICKYSYCS